MKDILEKLYWNTDILQRDSLKRKVWKDSQEAVELQRVLIERLGADGIELMDRYNALREAGLEQELEEAFSRGFCLGSRLMTAVFGGNEE